MIINFKWLEINLLRVFQRKIVLIVQSVILKEVYSLNQIILRFNHNNHNNNNNQSSNPNKIKYRRKILGKKINLL